MTAPAEAAPADPVSRRRTFAIISHPDAGKTTLTEKLLLFGGAIQLAGEVKAKRNRVSTRSDWMGIERERGISVVTSVMTFEYGDCVFNLLDTPGHEDFSEDTYRTLTAVDSAIMVIDAAKGIEARTRKLFEVCRLRDIPIVTFVNKMDRESRDPFDLLDEIEKTLALDTAPVTWPIGRGPSFRRHLRSAPQPRAPHRHRRGADHGHRPDDDPLVDASLPPDEVEAWQEEVDARPGRLQALRPQGVPRGPSDAGVLRQRAAQFRRARPDRRARRLCAAAARRRRPTSARSRRTRTAMTGFVFKIQANMDPNHRDRIAFMRVCSGKLTRGMKAKLVRTGKPISLNTPQFFFAQDRAIADEALAGDVVGIPNHGTLRIGDTLTEGEDIVFRGVPSFAPEILRRIKLQDAMKAKKLREALQQMAEEGVVQLFLPQDGSRRHRRRRRRAAARRAEGAASRRIRAADRLRDDPLLALPLDHRARSHRTRPLRRRPWLVDGARPRRRAGLHGADALQAAIRAGSLARRSRFSDVKDYQRRDTSPEGRGRVAPGGATG